MGLMLNGDRIMTPRLSRIMTSLMSNLHCDICESTGKAVELPPVANGEVFFYRPTLPHKNRKCCHRAVVFPFLAAHARLQLFQHSFSLFHQKVNGSCYIRSTEWWVGASILDIIDAWRIATWWIHGSIVGDMVEWIAGGINGAHTTVV